MRRDLICVPIEALQANPDPRPQIWAMGKNDSLEEKERRVLYKPWVVPYAAGSDGAIFSDTGDVCTTLVFSLSSAFCTLRSLLGATLWGAEPRVLRLAASHARA